MQTMKLLIINDFGTSGGGTENRIHTLIDYFLEKRSFEEIHIIQKTSLNQVKKNNRPENQQKVSYHVCPEGHFRSYFFTKKTIKRHDIDLVQAHNMMALTPMPLLAAKHLKKPIVWYAHDYWVMCAFRNFIDPRNAMKRYICGKAYGRKCGQCRGSLRNSLRLMLWRWIINGADHAIATGRNMIDIYTKEGILREKWEIVTPWIDPLMIFTSSKQKRDKNILFVGSLMDYKGAWVVIKALKGVLKNNPSSRLILAGDEQDSVFRERVEKIASEYGVLKNIDFIGKISRERLKYLLRTSGVFVCPTVCIESFGLNWAEAMAHGCPVIASSIGTIPEHIDGKNGLIFMPRDYTDLASKINLILGNRELSSRIGITGTLYAKKNFDINKNGKKILKLYNELLKKTD